ncbi:MAG TPA: hypothetical protein VMT18_10875 [Planctomycetota bacterium]|nr:hypothetical protein [Planctomycetota bacterium]
MHWTIPWWDPRCWLSVGEDVNVQLWYRDPLPSDPGNANLSNLAFYTVQ